MRWHFFFLAARAWCLNETVVVDTTSSVGAGDGVGSCFAATENTTATVVVEALAINRTAMRIKSKREHLYVAAFALDTRRDLLAFESKIKLRRGQKLEATFQVPKDGTLHIIIACNAIDESSVKFRYVVKGHFRPGVSDGCGWRGAVLEEKEVSETLPKRILCIDGGGARGVVPLAMLGQAEKIVSSARVRERFDFFAGTSTGALVAAAIAIAEFPIQAVDRLYDDLARLIFGSKGISSTQRATRFEALLTAVFGKDARLGRTATQPRRVLFVSTDATTSRLRPYVFRNYHRGGLFHKVLGDQAPRVVDALLASAAAPPYFPSQEKERLKLLDGALIANNPTLVAILEAAALGADEPEVIVSLGTGVAPTRAARRGSQLHSAVDLIQGVMNLLTDTDAAHDLVQTYLESIRRNRNAPTRYHRLDVIVDASHLDLAEGDSLKLTDLRHLALDYVKREKPYHWKGLLSELAFNADVLIDEDDDFSGNNRRRRRYDPDYSDDDVFSALGESRVVRRKVATRDAIVQDLGPTSDWLRPLRKRAAKVTGIHGFFSGKKHPTTSK